MKAELASEAQASKRAIRYFLKKQHTTPSSKTPLL